VIDADKEQFARSQALMGLRDTPGWGVLEAEIKERMETSLDKIEHMMDSKPEMLTGKVAFRHAMRHKAYKEILEWVYEEIKAGSDLERGK
jgi:hypothetical protein